MEEEKKLYPLRFVHITEKSGEDVHIADLGYQDSVVRNGWLSANSISEIMDMYLDRIVGERVFAYYGRQFPILVKCLDCTERTPLLVHPDDEIARQRFDFLGKAKLWYVASAETGSRLFLGFKRDVSAEEFYMACRHGNVKELLNVVNPKAGECYFIHPGLVHSAAEGAKIIEIAESSPLDFRLYDWGREFDGDEFEASLNLEEAFDFIDYRAYDARNCTSSSDGDQVHRLHSGKEFSVSEIFLKEALHINGEAADSFTIYTCVRGELIVRGTEAGEDECRVKAGDSILVPAEVQNFYLVPADADTLVLETVTEVPDEMQNNLLS